MLKFWIVPGAWKFISACLIFSIADCFLNIVEYFCCWERTRFWVWALASRPGFRRMSRAWREDVVWSMFGRRLLVRVPRVGDPPMVRVVEPLTWGMCFDVIIGAPIWIVFEDSLFFWKDSSSWTLLTLPFDIF